MPLLEVQQIKKLTATVTLEQSTAVYVDKYAAFIQATADDVVNKALEYVFSKDKEFQSFLASDAANSAPHSLRVKGSNNGVPKGRRVGKNHGSVVTRA
jgi:hypothetical protein